MLTTIATILLAAAPAPADWVEFPSGTPFPDTILFAQVDRARDEGSKITIPTLQLRRTSYDALTISVDCAARTVSFPGGPSRLRHNNAENGSTLVTTTPWDQAGGYAGPAEWLCNGRQPAALAGRNRVSGDPKAGAWKRIDAYIDTMPAFRSRTFASAAPHLSLSLNGTTTALASASSDACWVNLVLVDGRKGKLDLMAHATSPRRREISFGSVTIRGFTAEEYKAIEHSFEWMPAC